MHRIYFFGPFLILMCLYAIWKGGAPERIAAWLQLVAGFATPLLSRPTLLGRYDIVPLWVFCIDLALLVALYWLAVRSSRYWPILLAGFQLVAVMAHVVRFIDPTMLKFGYAFLLAFWAYPMLLTMVAGTWLHQRRLRTRGIDPPWRSFSAASIATGPNRRHIG